MKVVEPKKDEEDESDDDSDEEDEFGSSDDEVSKIYGIDSHFVVSFPLSFTEDNKMLIL